MPRFELSRPGGIAPYAVRAPLGASLRLDMRACCVAPDAGHGEVHRRPLFHWEPSGLQPSTPYLWPERGFMMTNAGTAYHPTIPEDDRSAWARWHSSMWGASATVGVLMLSMVAALSLLPHDVSGWNKPDFYGLKKNFTRGPNFDYDHAYFNYIAHPYDGSEFYLIARNRDLNWWQSFLYGAGVSTFFEFCIESAYEGASWQDLWITPVSGAVIGELRWQAKKALENPRTGKPVGTVNKILYVVVDPLDAIFSL